MTDIPIQDHLCSTQDTIVPPHLGTDQWPLSCFDIGRGGTRVLLATQLGCWESRPGERMHRVEMTTTRVEMTHRWGAQPPCLLYGA